MPLKPAVVKNKKLPVSSEQFLLMRISECLCRGAFGVGVGEGGRPHPCRAVWVRDAQQRLRLANKITVKCDFQKNNEYAVIMSRAFFGTRLY